MPQALNILIHVLVLLALPPLLLGVINKVKALFAGRVGPPVLQLYYDLAKLARKSTVTSRSTTWVFAAGPMVALVTAVLAGLLVPLTVAGAPIAFAGDAILLAYLFALGRFFTASAALDTGSAFEGMGAARDVTFACFAETALFLCLLVLARWSQPAGLSLSAMFTRQDGPLLQGIAGGWVTHGASLVLMLAALFMVLLAESCRIPFDDPNTHLELTMIHEVMVLDHSGPALGAILYAAAVKLMVLSALLVRVLVPVSTGRPWIDWSALVGGLVLVAALVGVVESIMARLRLRHVPSLLIGACLLAGLGFVLMMV